jgi:hypothetical protein
LKYDPANAPPMVFWVLRLRMKWSVSPVGPAERSVIGWSGMFHSPTPPM